MTNSAHRTPYAGLRATRVALTLIAGLATFLTASAEAQTFSVLYNFTGGTDGGNPDAQPVMDKVGNILGTSFLYGAYDDGTVWKLSSGGRLRVLHTFTGADGANPYNGVKLDKNGNMFGTTTYGGSAGWGTAYRISPDGTFTKLYDFGAASGDPEQVYGVVHDPFDNLYGTSEQGPAPDYGTVWKLTKDGGLSVLHYFTGGNDGAYPNERLYRDSAGNLYGLAGGFGSFGCGTLFKMSVTGTFTVLHSFNGSTDGCVPCGTLREYKGSLYATTRAHSFGQWAGVHRQGVAELAGEAGYEDVVHRAGESVGERVL